jgi:hypothetical protein
MSDTTGNMIPTPEQARLDACPASSVEASFRADLLELLANYDAEMEAKDHWEGYAECGEDIRITVDIPAIYDAEVNCLREATEINLGAYISPPRGSHRAHNTA